PDRRGPFHRNALLKLPPCALTDARRYCAGAASGSLAAESPLAGVLGAGLLLSSEPRRGLRSGCFSGALPLIVKPSRPSVAVPTISEKESPSSPAWIKEQFTERVPPFQEVSEMVPQ